MASDSSTQPFRVAIVGGGIGGLFAALAINHFCPPGKYEVDVYEQAHEYKEIGAGVGIGVNAAKLVHEIGLGDQLNEICGRRSGIWINFVRYDDGSNILEVPLHDPPGKVHQASVHRAEFLDILHNAIIERKAARLHVNKKCAGVEVGPFTSITCQ